LGVHTILVTMEGAPGPIDLSMYSTEDFEPQAKVMRDWTSNLGTNIIILAYRLSEGSEVVVNTPEVVDLLVDRLRGATSDIIHLAISFFLKPHIRGKGNRGQS